MNLIGLSNSFAQNSITKNQVFRKCQASIFKYLTFEKGNQEHLNL